MGWARYRTHAVGCWKVGQILFLYLNVGYRVHLYNDVLTYVFVLFHFLHLCFSNKMINKQRRNEEQIYNTFYMTQIFKVKTKQKRLELGTHKMTCVCYRGKKFQNERSDSVTFSVKCFSPFWLYISYMTKLLFHYRIQLIYMSLSCPLSW